MTERRAAITGDPPPPAPGSLGDAPELLEIDAYLTALLGWRDRMRITLDRLDARARSATTATDLTADVTLAFAVWQSISTRVDRLVATWDGGRVGAVERDRLTELIWGRLGGSLDVALAVSFVEACVLADALVTRLQARLDVDPMGAAGVGERVQPIREQLDRCRAYDVTPAQRAALDQLSARLDTAVADARAGADRADEVAAIEADASRIERDLIVAAAVRASSKRDARRLGVRLAAAIEHARAVRDLARRCAEKITDPPRVAVPDPAVLGAVPDLSGDPTAAGAALDAFATRLDNVERALAEAQRRYGTPLERRSELRGMLDAYRDMAKQRGRAEDSDLQATYDRAHAVLYTAPLDLAAGAAAVAEYEHAVRAATKAAGDAPGKAEGTS